MTEIKMPQAGQSMEDGTIVKWCKAEGQVVQAGEVLLEVETDKAVVEVESPASGTLRQIVVGEGTTVPCHTVIALLGDPGEALPERDAGVSATTKRSEDGSPASGVDFPSTSPAVAGIPNAGGPSSLRFVVAETPASRETATPPAGVVPVLMPQAGQSMEEGLLVTWRVKPGDAIKVGDVIFEVETDKATIEVEATDAGRLSRVVVHEGDTAVVLTPVAYLADDDAAVDAFLRSTGVPPVSRMGVSPMPAQPVGEASAPKSGQHGRDARETGRVKASPAARKVAAERGVDLASVGAGSGPGGRILSTDVPAAGAVGGKSAPNAGDPSSLRFVVAETPASREKSAAPTFAAPTGEFTRRRMSGMRKAIARNLLASKQNIPHFYMRLTIDASPLMAFYKAQKAKYTCSVNDVVTAAVARCVMEFPGFRSRVDGEEIVEFANANIGIAVGMDDGLVVPVIASAQGLSVQQLAAQTRRLADNARKGKIEGMGTGVVTITNLGMFGVEEFSAIINPPEAAILAVGAVREAVQVVDGGMRPGKAMTMTLSADHRIIDGLLAAKFLARLKEILQGPEQFLMFGR